MAESDLSIAALFRPHQRYVRAVHLERDFDDTTALQDYVVTDKIRDVLERMIAGVANGSRQRAWRLTGDYGSGKSSLALALAHVLTREPRSLPRTLRSFATRKKTGLGAKRMFPVLLTGAREPLNRALLRRLVERLEHLTHRGRDPMVLTHARSVLEDPDSTGLDQRVIELIEETMAYLRKSGRAAGFFLVIDELGKFLEYALLHPERQDAYFLQELAELSSRSDDFPLVVLGVLHQGFSAYTARSSTALQNEWEKIAGRYEEVVFRQSLDQALVLAGSALHTDTTTLPESTRKRHASDLNQVLQLGWFGSSRHSVDSTDALSIYPIHPTAFPVLARLFQRFGQNERSLFGFLFSGEPGSLQAFAANTSDLRSFYRIHHIYDYIKANLGYRLQHEPGSRWSMLESLVESYVPHEEDDTERHVLETVAVLNLLDSQGLLATDHAIQLALAEKRSRVKRALEILTQERRVLYRRGKAGGYCLWPHTSVDILQCYTRAQRELGPLDQLAPHARDALETRPIVARRHYIETGNLRYFTVHYAPASELETTLESLDDVSDGHIVVALCESHEDRQSAMALARAYRADEDPDDMDGPASNVLIAVPPPLEPLAPLFQDVRCWEWVRTNVPELSQDRFAEREVSRVLNEARQRLSSTINDLLGLRQGGGSADITWYRAGQVQTVASAREFLGLLSEICDRVYFKGPTVHNELINRAELSTAAAAARMRLIEGVFQHPNEPYLGMDPEKKPPEMSMYLSVLAHANLHRANSRGEWGFSLPAPTLDTCNLLLSLLRINDLLREARESRVPIPDIVHALRAPPYGVRDGLIPLLIAVACAIDEQHVAMYEEGSFVREIKGEHFSRMLKFPDAFELQYFKISGVRSALFHQLLRVLDPEHADDESINILDVVRPLLRFMGQLPNYTFNTRRLSQEALAVRKVLRTSREPAPLIFQSLPRACGIDEFASKRGKHDKRHIQAFVDALRKALDELRAAYPDLLTRMRQQVGQAFDLQDNSFAEVREHLGRKGERASFVIREPRLKGFCLRMVDNGLAEQPWLEALGSYVCSKPPKSWYDADADRFADELSMLVERFQHAESLAFGQHGADDDEEPEEAVRVSLMQPDGTQLEQVITVSPDEMVQVDDLEQKIADLLADEQRRIGLAAVSRALWKALDSHQGARRGQAAKRNR